MAESSTPQLSLPATWLGSAAWVSVWLALALLAALIPPMQSPDEPAHLGRAATLAEGRWLMQTPPGHDTGQWVDNGLLDYMRTANKISGHAQARSDAADQEVMASQRWSGQSEFFQIPGMNYYLPVLYAPHAAGLLIGRAMNLSIAHSYQLVRVLVWTCCVLLLAAAWRALTPPPLAVALLLLPMSTFQLASPTLDGLTACLALWVLSVFCRRCMTLPTRTHGDWLWLAGVVALASGRTHLLPLLLLPLVLAWRQGTTRAWLSAALAAALSLAWVLFTLATTRDTRIARDHSSKELLLHYAQHPFEFLLIVNATLNDPAHAQGYAETFVGRLGWLDTYLPMTAYDWLWWGLALCALLSLPIPRFKAGTDVGGSPVDGAAWTIRLSLLTVAAGSVLLVFLALLVTWTPHPARFIDGVQGRYFLIPALMLAYASSDLRRRTGVLTLLRWAVLIAFAGLAGWACVSALLVRYG